MNKLMTASNFSFSTWALAARPKTLLAGVCPVLAGSALAAHVDSFHFIPAFLCLLFALSMQIGCNFANDYYDHAKGADNENRIGFTRTVASGMISPWAMKKAMFIMLAIGFLISLLLIPYAGWWVLFIGVLSVVSALAYTAGPYPLAYVGLGDLFVLIFFGFVAVMFTFFAQTSYFSWSSLWVALGVGLMAANIRTVNDVRDVPTDEPAGKRTLAVRFGKRFACQQYLISFGIAQLVPLFLIISGHTYWVLLTFITIPFGLHLAVRLMQAQSGPQYNRLLELTAKLLLVYTLLLSVALVW